MTQIGTLEVLRRYPVKSMRGEDLETARIAYTGVAGDRVFAFVNDEKNAAKNNFPWHSAREQYDMLLYKPRFRAAPPPELEYPDLTKFGVDVTTPDGKTFAVDDPALKTHLEAKVKYTVTLRFSEKGMQDSRPVSIFGLQTLEGLGGEVGRTLDHRRFRANFYVRWTDPTPFFEDALVGKTLKVGNELELQVVKKDPRCIIISLDPESAELHPEVLKTVAKKHGGCVGVYAAVIREGIVSRGDAITVV